MNKTRAYEVYTYFRDEAGLTDYKVSQQTGISPSVLSQWKRGEYNLKLEKLQRLAKLFQIPVELFWNNTPYRY